MVLKRTRNRLENTREDLARKRERPAEERGRVDQLQQKIVNEAIRRGKISTKHRVRLFGLYLTNS